MHQIDLDLLSRDKLVNINMTMFTLMATYATLNQRLFDAFKECSKDDLPALVAAWVEAVERAEQRFDTDLAACLGPPPATAN